DSVLFIGDNVLILLNDKLTRIRLFLLLCLQREMEMICKCTRLYSQRSAVQKQELSFANFRETSKYLLIDRVITEHYRSIRFRAYGVMDTVKTF
ncbi:unnamed protein product, partial [Urochloa humidicola]